MIRSKNAGPFIVTFDILFDSEETFEAVREAGGTPIEFNMMGVCDGIAMGHAGMKYSLPSRELIADAVETMIGAHAFDAMICIPNLIKKHGNSFIIS